MPKKKTGQEISGQQAFFMRISNPTMFRKELLESSKIILNILKQIYGIIQIRKTQYGIMNMLSKEIKELKILIHKINELIPAYKSDDLKGILPEIYLKKKPLSTPKEEERVEEPEKQPSEIKEAKPEPGPAKKPSGLEKVTKALEEVQRRLQNL